MILNIILSLGILVLLVLQGRFVVRLLARGTLTSPEEWALGFPIGAFLNALLFFAFTLLGIPLTTLFVIGGHVLLLAIIGGASRAFVNRVMVSPPNHDMPQGDTIQFLQGRSIRILIIFLVSISLVVKGLYGFTHATLLPTFYYDTLSQWNMRSRISFEERQIAFDETQVRGISKPQYPILLHSLQIVVMLPHESWQDRWANTATFLLTCSSFLAFFLLLQRFAGQGIALLTLFAMFSIPLLDMHLVQGYGDIHVVEYLLLSAVFLACSFEAGVSPRAPLSRTRAFLSLSALFAAAASWAKLEGFFFVVVPWLLIVSFMTMFFVPKEKRLSLALTSFLPGALFGGLWILFLLATGFAIGPHSDDLVLSWHGQGLPVILKALFLSGSFGVAWYALPLLLLAFLLPKALQDWKQHIAALSLVLWGAITFFETLAIYLLTPNVEFLLNNQTFHRTMLLPLVLLMLGTAFLVHAQLRPEHSEETSM